MPRTSCRARGYTLVELVMVMAVLAVLVGIGVPGLRGLILTQRIKNASFDVFSTLTFARSAAITRNGTVTIAPVSGNWSNGWTISEAGGTVIRRQDALSNVTISGPAAVSYNAMGRLNSAVSAFSLNAAGVTGSNLRCISIDLSGRPVIKSEACS